MSNLGSPNYGSCWSCVSDLTMPAVMVGGNRAVAEAVARRLQTNRGRNVGDPNYGYDVTAFLDADVTQKDIVTIQSNVEAECTKDERILSATCTAILTGGVLILTIALTAASGPFTLVLSVSQVAQNPLQILAPAQ